MLDRKPEIQPTVPPYDPTDPEANVSVDWQDIYEGGDGHIPADRPVTVGHPLSEGMWPKPQELTEVTSEIK